ncbi:unnamed protein product [Linum trigynum]|uniref:Uncharacterized protein n=1 Tax=Linum trigynum TaxID=586398 RepID=A0AAV2EGD2_9ROSI
MYRLVGGWGVGGGGLHVVSIPRQRTCRHAGGCRRGVACQVKTASPPAVFSVHSPYKKQLWKPQLFTSFLILLQISH